eukprot:4687-Heterococcus_DN1.PRE.6
MQYFVADTTVHIRRYYLMWLGHLVRSISIIGADSLEAYSIALIVQYAGMIQNRARLLLSCSLAVDQCACYFMPVMPGILPHCFQLSTHHCAAVVSVLLGRQQTHAT